MTVNETCRNMRKLELRLVEIFFAAAVQMFSKVGLMDRLFSVCGEVCESAIEVYVGRRRKRVAGRCAEIETVRSLGYRLVARL